jgi:hypothetical protein
MSVTTGLALQPMAPAPLDLPQHPPAPHLVSTAFHRSFTHPMPTAGIIAFSDGNPSRLSNAVYTHRLAEKYSFIFGKCLSSIIFMSLKCGEKVSPLPFCAYTHC